MSKKWWLAVPGTIILGALGSGLWELCVKPSGHWFWNAMASLLTLGSHQLKDAIYQEASRSYHEHGALEVLKLVVIVLIGVGWSAFYTLYRVSRYIDDEINEKTVDDFKTVDELKKEIARIRASTEQLKSSTRRMLKLNRIMSATLIIPIIAFPGIEFSTMIKLRVASDLNTIFEQSLVICRPYIDDHSAYILRSRYAQVMTKDDYTKIMDDLDTIANRNKLKLPLRQDGSSLH